MKNTKLLIIFGVLLAIVAVVWYIDNSQGDSTFNGEILKIDTVAVDGINISNVKTNTEISLKKEATGWIVTGNQKSYPVDKNLIKNILMVFSSLNSDRLASRDVSKLKEYELDDSTGQRVSFYNGSIKTGDIVLGKFNFSQQQGGNMYGQNGGQISTFVRLAGESEVYTVEGFLKSLFGQDVNAYRNHTLAKIEKESITSLKFSYPADSSFTLEKQGTKWLFGKMIADSMAVVQYLNSLSFINGNEFMDGFSATGKAAAFNLEITGSGATPVNLLAYPADSISGAAIGNSANPGIFFKGNSGGLFKRIFKSPKDFLPKPKSKK
jgi:hypothetical protein